MEVQMELPRSQAYNYFPSLVSHMADYDLWGQTTQSMYELGSESFQQ